MVFLPLLLKWKLESEKNFPSLFNAALGVDPKNIDFRVLAKKLKAAESESSKTQAALWSQSFAKMAATRSKLETSSINENNENGKPSEVAA